MSLSPFVQRGTAQGDAVINGATVANFSGFANHNAHAVVKENPLAQCGAWVNFNARDPA